MRALAITLCAAIAAMNCGGGTTTGPTAALAVSAISLDQTSVAAGASAQGTVSLTAAAPTGGTSISIASSNPAVATVAAPVMVPAGSSSATFAVTATAAGTATLTASLNGSSRQSPMLTVTARVVLSALSLGPTTVDGGDSVTGRVTLTAGAPAGGAVVALSGGDAVTVPANVTVPGGSTSATFTIFTREVGGTIASTISGSYGGASASAVLTITRPTIATANFGVTGPSETETCTLVSNGSTLDCTFNGSTSRAPGTIIAWDWSYSVAKTFAQTTTGPTLAMPSVNCTLVPAPPLPAGVPWFTMVVTLTIHDNLGNVATVTDSGVRLLPQGSCGF